MRIIGRYILKKLLYLFAVVIGISLLSFVLANIAPTSPAEAYARRIAKAPSEEVMEKYDEEFGFNRSIPEQYVQWLRGALFLDFGELYATKKPVAKTLLAAMPTTLLLVGMSFGWILLCALPLGVIAARKEGGRIDRMITGIGFLSISVPGYFLGLLFLLIFGIRLHVMPIIGYASPASFLCASFILAFPMIGSISRILRSLLLENQYSPYIQYAKARGLSRRRVLPGHLLRNAAAPCIVLLGQSLGYLLAGTAVIENIFTIPGMGKYVLEAALNRDFPIINCYIVLIASCFVILNTAAEGLGSLLNPKRMKEGAS